MGSSCWPIFTMTLSILLGFHFATDPSSQILSHKLHQSELSNAKESSFCSLSIYNPRGINLGGTNRNIIHKTPSEWEICEGHLDLNHKSSEALGVTWKRVSWSLAYAFSPCPGWPVSSTFPLLWASETWAKRTCCLQVPSVLSQRDEKVSNTTCASTYVPVCQSLFQNHFEEADFYSW